MSVKPQLAVRGAASSWAAGRLQGHDHPAASAAAGFPSSICKGSVVAGAFSPVGVFGALAQEVPGQERSREVLAGQAQFSVQQERVGALCASLRASGIRADGVPQLPGTTSDGIRTSVAIAM